MQLRNQAQAQRDFQQFLTALKAKGFQLKPSDGENPLSPTNDNLLSGYLLRKHTSNGLTDCTYDILWEWLKVDQYDCEWSIAPRGVAEKQQGTKHENRGRMPIFTDTRSEQIKALEIDSQHKVWTQVMEIIKSPQANSHGKSRSRQSELSAIVQSYHNKPDQAEQCLAEVRAKQKEWQND